jgi:diguanylate cyclase (GGDEF)-like protein
MIKKMFSEFRLVAVVGLLLIPIGLLGWLFVNQSLKDVRFAQKELVGTQYLRVLLPIYGKLIDTEAPTPAQVAAFQVVRRSYDGVLDTGKEAGDLAALISENYFNFADAKRIAHSLISNVGDRSNLILDPDLDTYYLMDVALLHVPEVLSLAADLTEVTASRANVIDPTRNSQRQTILANQIADEFKDLSISIGKAFDGNSDGSSKVALAEDYRKFADAEGAFLKALNLAKKNGSALPAVVYAQHRLFVGQTMDFMKKSMAQLDNLLGKRIAGFSSRFTYSIAFCGFLTLAAIGFAFEVMRRLLHRMDDRIIYLAHHDAMTRLKNRGAFSDEMNAVLENAKITNEQVALHLVDMDNFKSVNDTLGHQTGDLVLKSLADRLLKNTRPADVVGRLGGDEFVVLQRFVSNEAAAAAFANRLVGAMHEPIVCDNQVVRSSISIGTAITPIHATTAETLMAYADMALYSAKASGRDRMSMFTAELEAEVQQRRRVEEEVRRAAAEERFLLNFQAQYDSKGVHIRGFEALLRLRSTTGQNIPPAVFIPVAEQLGLIQQIGEWVLNEACRAAAKWPHDISLAVNLSPLQFSSGSIANIIIGALTKTGLDPKRLQVEITEGILMDDTENVLAELTAIRALGVSIVMDDFGTGYSSLGYLWRFPFDKIKIDRSFISALEGDDLGAQNILRTIVSLGHSLEMTVTAEGVETDAQAHFMNGLNCDEIQGFLYGKPVAEEELPSIILNSFQKSIGLKKPEKPQKRKLRKA